MFNSLEDAQASKRRHTEQAVRDRLRDGSERELTAGAPSLRFMTINIPARPAAEMKREQTMWPPEEIVIGKKPPQTIEVKDSFCPPKEIVVVEDCGVLLGGGGGGSGGQLEVRRRLVSAAPGCCWLRLLLRCCCCCCGQLQEGLVILTVSASGGCGCGRSAAVGCGRAGGDCGGRAASGQVGRKHDLLRLGLLALNLR